MFKVEVRNYNDGSVEVIVSTDWDEPVARLRVERQGHNDDAVGYEVDLARRASPTHRLADAPGHVVFVGGTFDVYVPAAPGPEPA